jgi:HK97 family phage major capsid protein
MADNVKHYRGGAVKVADDGSVSGYLIRFSDQDGAVDLSGEFFTSATETGLRVGKTIPVLYDHAMGDIRETIGDAVVKRIDNIGIWIQGQLDRASEYWEAVKELAERGALGWSSGALSHAVDYEGKAIKRWIVGEASLTPTPAEPRNRVQLDNGIGSGGGEAEGVFTTRSAQPTDAAPAGVATKHEPEIDNEGGITMSDEVNIEAEGTPVPAPSEAVDAEALAAKFDSMLEARLDAFAAKMQPVKEEGIPMPEKVATIGHVKRAADDRDAEAVKAFDLYARTGDRSGLKALEVGTAGEGGYIVPQTWSSEIVEPLAEMSVLRRAGARVLSVAGTQQFNVPTLTNSTAAVLAAEEGDYETIDPSFGTVPFNPYKYTKLTLVSEELLADNIVNLAAVLGRDAAVSFATAENTAFTTGGGSGAPQGVVTGAALGKETASGTAITSDEVIDLFYSVDHMYHTNAVWMMNQATIAYLRSLKASTSGVYQWGDMIDGSIFLMGKPIIINNSMESTRTAGDKVILFGDFSYYWIADFNQGIPAFLRLNERYAELGQVGFRWGKRFDGNVVNSAAIKYLMLNDGT